MKNRLLRIPIMVILVGLFLSAGVGCKKDTKDDDPPVVVKKYRLTSVKETESGVTYETKFEYNSDNKIVGMNGFMGEMAVSKGICVWTGNEARLSQTHYDGTHWNEDPYYVIFSYTGNHLTETRSYENDNLIYRVNYTWEGDRVTEEISEFLTNDTIIGSYGARYIYTGDQMTTIEIFSGDYVLRTLGIEYVNGKPVALKAYASTNEMYEYMEMIYTGNNMTKINEHFVTQGTSSGIRCSEDRTYDSNNNAIGITISCTGSEPSTSNLAWQEGTGNLSDMVLADYGWLTLYLFPDTFPSNMVIEKKSPDSPAMTMFSAKVAR